MHPTHLCADQPNQGGSRGRMWFLLPRSRRDRTPGIFGCNPSSHLFRRLSLISLLKAIRFRRSRMCAERNWITTQIQFQFFHVSHVPFEERTPHDKAVEDYSTPRPQADLRWVQRVSSIINYARRTPILLLKISSSGYATRFGVRREALRSAAFSQDGTESKSLP